MIWGAHRVLATTRRILFGQTCMAAVLICCGIVLFGEVTLAATSQYRLAVVELRNDAEMRPSEIAYLTDLARTQARDSLPAERFLVMTRESIVALLPPGKTLLDCAKSQCEVEVGRTIGADYIVSGEVLRFGDELRLNLKVHACASGDFLGSVPAKGAKLNDLEAGVTEACGALFAKVRMHAGVGWAPARLTGSGVGAANDAGYELVANGEAVIRGDLMWTVRDNGRDVTWKQAKAYCEACRVGGYSDWRMPTIEELEGLYDAKKSYEARDSLEKNPLHIAKLEALERVYDAKNSYKARDGLENNALHIAMPFQLTAPWQWSSTLDGSSSAFYFNFAYGRRSSGDLAGRLGGRVLCVRRSGE
jgi:TolB-like protein